ncbi:MAG: hypothetical protein ACFFAZ_10710 [Promethearchaeota archaeon]
MTALSMGELLSYMSLTLVDYILDGQRARVQSVHLHSIDYRNELWALPDNEPTEEELAERIKGKTLQGLLVSLAASHAFDSARGPTRNRTL